MFGLCQVIFAAAAFYVEKPALVYYLSLYCKKIILVLYLIFVEKRKIYKIIFAAAASRGKG